MRNVFDETGDVWNLRYGFDSDRGNKRVRNFRSKLINPVVGYWRKSTQELAFLPKSLKFHSEFEVEGPEPHGNGSFSLNLLVDQYVYGTWDGESELVIATEFDYLIDDLGPLPDARLKGHLFLQLETTQSPPQTDRSMIPDFGECTNGAYVLPSSKIQCSDAQNDLNQCVWFDGDELLPYRPSLGVGVHHLTLFGEDDRSTFSSANYEIEVGDSKEPQVTCEDVLLECAGPGGTPGSGPCSVTDQCDTTPTLINFSGGVYPIGSTPFSCSAIDDAGLTDSATCQIRVEDTLAPNVFCTPVGKECTGVQTSVDGECGAFDVCKGTLPTVSTILPTYPVGHASYVCSAHDDEGQTGNASCSIDIFDTKSPTFTFVPPTTTITKCVGASIGQATAVDVCDSSITITNNAPAKFPLGTRLVVWSARDDSGNIKTATQTVIAELADDESCCPAGTNVIVGTQNSDTINGTANSDCIVAKGGNDTVNAHGGNDWVSGGEGQDVVNGGAGNDTLIGGNASSTIDGGDGHDVIQGGPAPDILTGGNGNDHIDGRAGHDTCFAAPGSDTLVSCP